MNEILFMSTHGVVVLQTSIGFVVGVGVVVNTFPWGWMSGTSVGIGCKDGVSVTHQLELSTVFGLGLSCATSFHWSHHYLSWACGIRRVLLKFSILLWYQCTLKQNPQLLAQYVFMNDDASLQYLCCTRVSQSTRRSSHSLGGTTGTTGGGGRVGRGEGRTTTGAGGSENIRLFFIIPTISAS